MASLMTELISRTSVLSDSLTTSGIGRLAVWGRVVQVRASSCDVARAVGGGRTPLLAPPAADSFPWCIRGIAWVNAVGFGDGRSQGTRRSFDGNQPPLGQKAQLAEQHPVVRVGR